MRRFVSSNPVFLELAMTDFRQRVFAQPQVKQICELLGILCVSWNDIELSWYLIYTCLAHEAPREKLDAVFQQFQTGASQRKMIADLADKTFDAKSPFRTRIGQLIAVSHDLSGERNAFVHGEYTIRTIEERAGISLSIAPGGNHKKKPNKMAGKDIEREMKECIERMNQHADQLSEFRDILVQEFLPKEKRIRPYPPEVLANYPPQFRDALPRVLRERIAPLEFRAKDEE